MLFTIGEGCYWTGDLVLVRCRGETYMYLKISLKWNKNLQGPLMGRRVFLCDELHD